MDALEDLMPTIPVARACAVLGVSRGSLYRHTAPPPPRTPRLARPARALPDKERREVIGVLHSPEFADQPPREVYAMLLSMGIYLASVRTMYRILAGLRESGERRRGHERKAHPMPQLEAFAPNEVWTWDITKVAGASPGIFYCVFTILDLFSRYVVGWMVGETENAALAIHLINETIARHGVPAATLTVHSDRGAPMTAGTMTQHLASLGIEQSFSRPRVSNDNPFVESSFKTAKYQPDYPGRFTSPTHVRAWFGEFYDWYGDHHHHEGLALFTPADVFYGRVPEVAAVRQSALDAAYEAHPERFAKGPPKVRLPPTRVHINLPPVDAATPPPCAKSEVLVPPDAAQPASQGGEDAGPRERPNLIRITTGDGAQDAPQQSPTLHAGS